ncbi:jg15278 [Pararge aegeria aegeria]|uniref:Jg15278 protein n=1 Tax=Pararge aegeria aegeria TaxID=348720 RepID=A0A8S4R3Z7_9NEOP|nr:jg15278 [Pararge aegeria aegeria]
MEKGQLIRSATRYIAGRHAVQTVYYRRTAEDGKVLKTTKMTFFGKHDEPKRSDTAEMFAKIRERYS